MFLEERENKRPFVLLSPLLCISKMHEMEMIVFSLNCSLMCLGGAHMSFSKRIKIV